MVFYHNIVQRVLTPTFAGLFFYLFFCPEDGSDMFLRNIRLSPNYMALQTQAKFERFEVTARSS
jgi:hypothetical protein